MTMNRYEASERAHLSWAATPDRTARTAPARRGLYARFEREARQALGDRATDRQVADAADSALKAHHRALSAAGVAARKARRRAS